MQLETGCMANCESFMQSVIGLQDEIRVRYADLIDAEFPRFSDAEMKRRLMVAD